MPREPASDRADSRCIRQRRQDPERPLRERRSAAVAATASVPRPRIRRCFGESNEARGYGRDGSESDDVTGADCGQDRTAEVKGRSPTLGLMGSRPLIQPPADASPLPCLLKTGSMEEP